MTYDVAISARSDQISEPFPSSYIALLDVERI